MCLQAKLYNLENANLKTIKLLFPVQLLCMPNDILAI